MAWSMFSEMFSKAQFYEVYPSQPAKTETQKACLTLIVQASREVNRRLVCINVVEM